MSKAILINPFNKTIEMVDYDFGGSYLQISHLIGTEECVKPLFCAVDIDGTNTVYIDDEGLYRETQAYFMWEGYHQPLQGKGLILGTDYDNGESIPTTLSLDEVKEQVSFQDNVQVAPSFTVTSFETDEEMLEALGLKV
tara:strand:- start:297 stop:713 length:417 start_codon:yes stop_codon:yes gene_type:complete